MLSENHIFTLLNMESWEIFTPFLGDHSPADVPTLNKDVTKHNDYEILVGLEGVYPYYYNDVCYDCKPGSIFLISPMLEHESYYTEIPNSITHMWMFVNEQSLIVSISQTHNEKLKDIFRSKVAYEDYTPKLKIYEIWNSLINAKKITPQNLLQFKLAICHLFLAIIESKQLSINEYQGEIMERTRNYIKTHFHQKIDIRHLARKMGYSKFHFMRLFKKYYTVTIQEYIDQQRLKKVECLLADKTTQKEMAHQLGFSSQSSFANWYGRSRNK
jgi:AraC-like DNA-binding protein